MRGRASDRWAAELPLAYATMLAELDRAIARGTEDRITNAVQRVTGRPPRSFRAFMAGERRA